MIETNCKADIFSKPEDLGSITDLEVAELAACATDALRSNLNHASTLLFLSKLRSADKTPWRELLAEFRETLPFKSSIEVVEVDGSLRTQEVFTEGGFGLEGLDQLMFHAVQQLDAALAAIENFDPAQHVNKEVIAKVSSRAAKSRRPSARTRSGNLSEIGVWLKTAGYKDSLDKEGIIDRADREKGWCETDVREAAKLAGLTRPYSKSTK